MKVWIAIAALACSLLSFATATSAQVVTLSCDSPDPRIRQMYPGDIIIDIDTGSRTWRLVRGDTPCSGPATITERNYILQRGCSGGGSFEIDRATGDHYYCAPNETTCSRTLVCRRVEPRL